MAGFKEFLSEHLRSVLISILLCGAAVYYWGHLSHWGVARGWTANDTTAFKECVKRHLLDPKHYVPGEGALIAQLLEVSSGNTCQTELSDGPRRKMALADPTIWKPEEYRKLQTLWAEHGLVPTPDSTKLRALPTPVPTGHMEDRPLSPAELAVWLSRIDTKSSQPIAGSH